MSDAERNLDEAEVAKFAALASRWWDPEGEARPLHLLNPVRLGFVAGCVDVSGGLDGTRVLDVGCGGGLLSEAMAARGAEVTALDAAAEAIEVARLHLHESELSVDYLHCTVEEHLASGPEAYDLITCMELLEHVPDPAALVASCAQLLRPGGHLVASTLNRHPRAWLEAIVGAEFLLGMLPKGTHDYARFIRPAELSAWGRAAGLIPQRMAGMRYDPIGSSFQLADDLSVNYLVHLQRADA